MQFRRFLKKIPAATFFVNWFWKWLPRPLQRCRNRRWYILFHLNFILHNCGWCTQDCSSCRQCRRGRAVQSSHPLVQWFWSQERKADCAHNLCSARPMIKGYMEHCRDVKEMHIKFVREQKQVNFVKIKWKGKGNPCLFKRHFLQRKPVLSGGGPSSLQRGKSLTWLEEPCHEKESWFDETTWASEPRGSFWLHREGKPVLRPEQ